MTTAKEDSVTNPADEAGADADAERLFAEAAEAIEGKPADKAGSADDQAAAATQNDDDEGTTTGEGEAGSDQQDQPGGSEGEAADEAAASGEGDIWATADPKLKAAFEEERRNRERAEQQFKSREGREAALQRRIAELQRQGGQGEEQPRKPLKELLADKNITALKEEYPDFAPLIDALAEAGERVDGVSQQVGEVRTAAVSAGSAAEERALNQAVPNWLELAKDERFMGWVDDQPRRVRDIVHSNWDAITNAAQAAEVFKAFEQDINPGSRTETTDAGGGSSKRERQQAGAKVAKVNAPAVASGESDNPEVLFKQAAAKVDRERGLRT